MLLGGSAWAMQQRVPAQTMEPTVTDEHFKEVDKPVAVIAQVTTDEQTEEKVEEPVQPEPITEAAPVIKKKEAAPVVAPVVAVQVPDMPEKPAVVAVAVAETVPAPVEEKIAPANPFRLGAAREYRFVTKITVKNNGDATSTGVRLEIPLLTASSLYQVQSGETFSLDPVEIKNVQGTRVGVFSFEDLAPGAETVLELRYQVRTSVIEFFSDFVPKTAGSKPTQYLEAIKGIESDNTQIINLAAQVTGDKLTDWDKAAEITRWVAANISYDGAAATRNSGALAALQSKKGVCEDYAALAAALARASGIPARIAYGYTDNGTHWPASGSFALRGFRHAWVEYYLEGRGWVPAEPTRSTSTKLYFGTFPHNRYIVQNYNDVSLKGNYRGGKLAISWTESLE